MKNLSGRVVFEVLHEIYYEAVHWLPNTSPVPLGAVGKMFMEEINRLLRGFADATTMEPIAFVAVMMITAPVTTALSGFYSPATSAMPETPARGLD